MSVHFTFQVGQGDSHTGVRPVMGKVLQATEALHPLQAALLQGLFTNSIQAAEFEFMAPATP